jgi:hypothetical protein
MKHINLAIDDKIHEQYKKLQKPFTGVGRMTSTVPWIRIIKAGLEIIEMAGSYEAYLKLIQKIQAGK